MTTLGLTRNQWLVYVAVLLFGVFNVVTDPAQSAGPTTLPIRILAVTIGAYFLVLFGAILMGKEGGDDSDDGAAQSGAS